MNKKIVIINGNGGVGKDTFVDFCSNYAKVKKASTVDIVKEAARILVSYNNETDEKTRKFLSDLKTLSSKYNDAPYKYLIRSVDEFLKSENDILFLFVREIREIKKLKKDIDAITLLIKNDDKKFIKSNYADEGVLNYDYDYIIINKFEKQDFLLKAEEFVGKILND